MHVMRWCLRVKLAQHWDEFSNVLLETGDRPIVEQSRVDSFWGAKPLADETLVGCNVLGRLLMELREAIKKAPEQLKSVPPPPIPDFRLYNEPIQTVYPVDIVIDNGESPTASQAPRLFE